MRKETSAGLKAGAVSGATLGLIILAIESAKTIPDIESRFNTTPILHPIYDIHTVLLFAEIFTAVMLATLFSFIGATAGFIYVKAVNKLPLRSTYVKAVLPWAVLLILLTIANLAYHPSPTGIIRLVTVGSPLVGEAILFAYLFKRWTKHEQSTTMQASELAEKVNG